MESSFIIYKSMWIKHFRSSHKANSNLFKMKLYSFACLDVRFPRKWIQKSALDKSINGQKGIPSRFSQNMMYYACRNGIQYFLLTLSLYAQSTSLCFRIVVDGKKRRNREEKHWNNFSTSHSPNSSLLCAAFGNVELGVQNFLNTK